MGKTIQKRSVKGRKTQQKTPGNIVPQRFPALKQNRKQQEKVGWEELARMRSPVQIWVAAPEKPVVPQGIAGFCFCLAEKLSSRKPIQKPIPIDFKVLIHITPDQLFSEHL